MRNPARGAERTSPAVAEAGRTAAAVEDTGRGNRRTSAAAGGRSRTRSEADTPGEAERILGADTCCNCTVVAAGGGGIPCRRAPGAGMGPGRDSPEAEGDRGCSNWSKCCCSRLLVLVGDCGGFEGRSVCRPLGWKGFRGFRRNRGRLRCRGRSRVVGRWSRVGLSRLVDRCL